MYVWVSYLHVLPLTTTIFGMIFNNQAAHAFGAVCMCSLYMWWPFPSIVHGNDSLVPRPHHACEERVWGHWCWFCTGACVIMWWCARPRKRFNVPRPFPSCMVGCRNKYYGSNLKGIRIMFGRRVPVGFIFVRGLFQTWCTMWIYKCLFLCRW